MAIPQDPWLTATVGPEGDAAVRMHLISGYDSWAADLKAVLSDRAIAADVSSWGGGHAGETQLNGKTAAYTTELRFGSARPTVRIALTYTATGWRIRGAERAP